MFFQRYNVIRTKGVVTKVTLQFETFNRCAAESIFIQEVLEGNNAKVFFEGIRNTEDETGLDNLYP